MMDDEFKWPAIMFASLVLSAAISLSFSTWGKTTTERTAMENGYVQTFDEASKRVIWVKGDAVFENETNSD